ncbi:hypothetical protein [Paraburkholderia graminis]|uniref:Uncharacterized protein n=1 Tax=Paraburkholderia graminis TaxID=60548 RepID=A0ABD5CRR1_9BURK|nr:hypothetical protein [Paraburkholderia graminis]MDR6208031.1 hypothetical protein [Paraburkholderia graminis]
MTAMTAVSMATTSVATTVTAVSMATTSVATTVIAASVATSKHSPEIHVTPVSYRYSLTARKKFSIGIVPKLAVLAHAAIFA